ncbi:MAG TPA: hypothetical protein VK497_03790 [Candidatus Saccharimonadales bacterium]|nr:hypothetical protein [Candidatus Saccharimonadales bacterium]
MTEQASYYSPSSEYAFPGAYDVAKDEALFALINQKHFSDIPFVLDFSPRDALLKWSESSPGRWQAKQTARYAGFHRDLDTRLIPDEFEGREEEFRHRLLGAMTLENYRNPDHARFDFHPLGHQARVACQQEQILYPIVLSGSVRTSPEMLDVMRHAAPIHDIAETEHPGVVIEHGSALGDISPDQENEESKDGRGNRGKTDADRQKEHDILVSLLTDLYHENYTPEMREMLVKLISHRIDGESPEFVRAHGIVETGHNFNSANTGIYLGIQASQVNSIYGNLMSALAEQHIRILRPKIQSAFDHSPELIAPLKYTADKIIQDLEASAHSRDENDDFIKWRTSDKITEVLGEYQKWEF